MEAEDLQEWAEEFTAFHARFASLFGRSEPREQAAKYLRGLLARSVQRKNGWQMAEAVGDAIPDPMQRLLYRTLWDADAARDRLQDYIAETFGDPQALVVIDETGFLKKGTHSVGAQRQYTGTAGMIENAQWAPSWYTPAPESTCCWTAASTCPRAGQRTLNSERGRVCRRG